MIQFENVTATYGNDVGIFDLSFHIKKGEMVFLMGPTGAGKSTVLKTIYKDIILNDGSLYIDGQDITYMRTRKIPYYRRKIGMIFQTFNLVHRTTVLNNVLMGRLSAVPAWRSTFGLWPEKDREKAMQSLERVGIVEKAYVRASDLSGGQQQRVGIARALAQDPLIMLADEPVAALDPITSRQVMTDLQRINEDLGITTLVNLHFLDLAREYGKRLIGLREGELVFDGDIADVTDETFQQIYGRSITEEDLLTTETRND